MRQRRTAVFIFAVLALVSALLTGRALLYNIAYLLGLLLILSFAWAWINISAVRFARTTRTFRTQVGRPLEERFIVRNTSIIPILWLEVRDFSALPDHLSSQVINTLGPRGQFSWRVNTVCQERGRYQLGPIRLTTSDPFGLFPMQRQDVQTRNVVVYPMTVDIMRFALPVGILPGGDALRRRTHYVTTNASGVRDYAPGDSFSRIHWRSTARRNRLIVKEFELDPLADIWIIPDMARHHVRAPEESRIRPPRPGDLPSWLRRQEFRLPKSTEEYTVTIAASLAQYFLRHDRAVGMLAYGQSNEVVQPDRSERQLNRILETLAVLRAAGQVPLADMINAELHLFPRGTTLIVVTPTTRETWATAARQLTRRGLRLVTVLVDPASFDGKVSVDPLASLLEANNLVSYVVRYGDDLTAALSRGRTQAGYYTMS
ncbi:MAG: DUF58 domain-containing protein [Anaerolineales bacterium]|nr:DUF58 domain-containing protein [Anaerolineales bacterium]